MTYKVEITTLDQSKGTTNNVGNISVSGTITAGYTDNGTASNIRFSFFTTAGQDDMDGQKAANKCQAALNRYGLDCPDLVNQVQEVIKKHYDKPQYKKV